MSSHLLTGANISRTSLRIVPASRHEYIQSFIFSHFGADPSRQQAHSRVHHGYKTDNHHRSQSPQREPTKTGKSMQTPHRNQTSDLFAMRRQCKLHHRVSQVSKYLNKHCTPSQIVLMKTHVNHIKPWQLTVARRRKPEKQPTGLRDLPLNHISPPICFSLWTSADLMDNIHNPEWSLA